MSKKWGWDTYQLNLESTAPINAPGYRRELKGSRVTLFGTGTNLGAETLAKLSWQTERDAQKALKSVAFMYKGLIKIAIKDFMDKSNTGLSTGATEASVYVLLPPALSSQKNVINGTDARQRTASTANTFRNFKIARKSARLKNKRLGPDSSFIDDDRKNVGRLKRDKSGKSDYEPDQMSWTDIPFNPPGTVARKNLYIAVGVGTSYSIFPHEGLGKNAKYGARRFFSPFIERMQEDFAITFKSIMEKDLQSG